MDMLEHINRHDEWDAHMRFLNGAYAHLLNGPITDYVYIASGKVHYNKQLPDEVKEKVEASHYAIFVQD